MYRFPGFCLLWRINPEQEPEFAQNAPDYMPLRRQRLIRSIIYGGDPPCFRFDCGNFSVLSKLFNSLSILWIRCSTLRLTVIQLVYLA
jgi:hypothetical protein